MGLASWLLRTFGSGPTIETLVEDLREEYRRRRSAIWFWRQAMLAIATTFVTQVRAHKLLTLRAIATGWMLVTGLSWIVRGVLPLIDAALDGYLPQHATYSATAYRYLGGIRVGDPQTITVDWQRYVAIPFVRIVLFALTYLVTGWAVARFHRQHRNPAVFSFVIAFVIFACFSQSD